MSNIKVLIIEDEKSQRQGYIDKIELYNENPRLPIKFHIPIDEKDNIADARNSLKYHDYDAVIVDLKLKGCEDGNEIIEEINQTKRVPVFIVTGTPSGVQSKLEKSVRFYKRTDDFNLVIEDILLTTQTGLSRIMGGRGVIEKALQKVYWDNIIPNLETWKKYANSGHETEPALLRSILNHAMEILGNDPDKYFPEEMYICTPKSTILKTGTIVKKKDSDEFFIVLSPACDLALHDGKFKTDRILLCEIDNDLINKKKKLLSIEIKENDSEKDVKLEKKKSANDFFVKLTGNGYANYYHFLPLTNNFHGGLINFRKISTYKPSEFDSSFEIKLKISAPFVKDIVARFSSYYARQGQPDFDFNHIAQTLYL